MNNTTESRVTDLYTIGLLSTVVLFAQVTGASAQDAKPIGQFITVSSPIDDVMSSRLTNAALELQSRADREDRDAVLVLELTPGSSRFGQVSDLAKFLTSSNLSRLRTVAWVPKSVNGNNAILALACQEIVMHPDAELGDIGRGKALEDVEQQFVRSIVNRKHNSKISPALAAGMMDPAATVLRVETGVGAEAQSRLLTTEEVKRLRDSNIVISNIDTIKEAGVVGTFSGSQASASRFLISQTAESRQEIAEIYHLPSESMRESHLSGEDPRVRLIRVDEMIEPVLESFVQRQIERAVSSGANTIIFEIDSPGGFLLSGENLAFAIADLPKDIRTVAWVPEQSLSAAAIIALACDEVYLAPDARIGDAGPLEIGEGGQFERAPEKILSVLRGTLKTLAEKKGRPPALLMAMADRNLKVYKVTNKKNGRVSYMSEDEIHESNGDWVQGPIVPESEADLLLTFDGERAHEVGIAGAPVQDIDGLKDRLGISPETKLVPLGRTWIDTFVFVLNTNAAMFLLFMIGVVCIYLELHFTTGLLGIISATCFALFFWSRFLGGTAGWLEVILFLLGVACVALEVFVIPGFGVFGVSGGLLMFVSLIMASQTFGNLEADADFSAFTGTIGTLGASIFSVIVVAVLFNQFLPSIPFLNQLILSPPGDENSPKLKPEFSLAGSSIKSEISLDLIGQTGTAATTLRPAGKATIGEQFLDVVSDGPFIKPGENIEVVEVQGNRIVVRRV